MRVSVVYASKHGSTREVAEVIATGIRRGHHQVDVLNADELGAIPEADAFVLGSAVYAGRWLKSITNLIDAGSDALADRPVWLFSVGPIGDDADEAQVDVDASHLIEACGARDHAVFAGKLDFVDLGLGERLLARALKAPEGDFRNWAAITDWAHGIETTIDRPERGAQDGVGAL